ncbi:MAG: acyl-CoA dehydrogenase family protein, partial [Methyloligellaceae bacterium]
MTLATDTVAASEDPVRTDLTDRFAAAAEAAAALLEKAIANLRADLVSDGRISSTALEREQHAAHGLAWLATYVESLKQMAAYTARMAAEDRLGELETLIAQIAFSDYLAQIAGGIPMSQGEFIRPHELGLSRSDLDAFRADPVATLITEGNTAATRARLIALIERQDGAATFGDTGLDETYEAMRDEMRRFADQEVVPHAHDWHLANAYIPLDVIEKMSELGVFGLTIPEEFGGLGLGKESMCVVSEELSRGYIGVGSLGTRSEIAAELILSGGTDAQKEAWLPKIASGEVLPTAVFTEPNTGSDLAALKTRAVLDGDVYRVTGQKTWITHPVRADLMTLLARTDPDEPGYRGLSMFL